MEGLVREPVDFRGVTTSGRGQSAGVVTSVDFSILPLFVEAVSPVFAPLFVDVALLIHRIIVVLAGLRVLGVRVVVFIPTLPFQIFLTVFEPTLKAVFPVLSTQVIVVVLRRRDSPEDGDFG